MDYKSANEAYRAANLWRECLATATLVPLPQDEMKSLASSLASDLLESKDYQAAACVQLDYLADVESASRSLCRGYHYEEALRLIGLKQRPDLIALTIDPGLIEGSATMTELLADCKTQLQAQIPRLRELRQKKADDPRAYAPAGSKVRQD